MTEGRMTVQHQVEVWNVGQLKEALAGVDDSAPVIVRVSQEPLAASSIGYVAVSGGIQDGLISKGVRGKQFVIDGRLPSGTYLSKPAVTLSVRFQDESDRPDVGGLGARVREAVRDISPKGEFHVRSSPQEAIFEWHINGDSVGADRVLDTMENIVQAANPGSWQISRRAG